MHKSSIYDYLYIHKDYIIKILDEKFHKYRFDISHNIECYCLQLTVVRPLSAKHKTYIREVKNLDEWDNLGNDLYEFANIVVAPIVKSIDDMFEVEYCLNG